ncbi:unannotated protein [freshwater metagenome]|uniref:Unannotated protein n=1 Tax=freshwater metagenome TaxID=449393 RepID=A0A6J6EWZ7_9ZZZZ
MVSDEVTTPLAFAAKLRPMAMRLPKFGWLMIPVSTTYTFTLAPDERST